MRFTYSRWDGTQGVEYPDADELLEALSDDILAGGDLPRALQRATSWGPAGDSVTRAPGLQDLLQSLRQQRRKELERYDLDSAMQDIADRVADIIESERAGLVRRLAEAPADAEESALLESIVRRKQSLLDSMPAEPGAAVAALADYEFLDAEARAKFEALSDMLRRHVLQRHFESFERSLGDLTGESLAELKTAVRALNEVLQDRLAGGSPDFESFVQRHGRQLPAAGSLDQLVTALQEQAQHTEALMASMTPAMRRSLEETLSAILRDPELTEQLELMAEAINTIAPRSVGSRGYPFQGEQDLTLDEALRLMRRMHDLEQLERSMLRANESGEINRLDLSQVARGLGADAMHAVAHLQNLGGVLEEAGYARKRGGDLELTARGIRRIGQKALDDIFARLKADAFGEHPVASTGPGSGASDDRKPYEFGDSFLLDLTGTMMNSVTRRGAATPVELSVSDFQVFRTEQLAQAATVLMVDMSRSMPLRGCFVAAKKVALALDSLIRAQFPRDRLYIITFSDYAREVSPEALHQTSWGDYVYGTNMQHGFMLARRLLGRHNAGSKQIILITDGEPTAHFESGRVHFAYPPTHRTFRETLKEVRRCTQQGIRINTFMLERSHYLTDFVNEMTRINRGRAFFATPERLGDYVLVDYMASKPARRVNP